MNSFIGALGTRIADKWLQALLFPGLLWTTTLITGLYLGQEHATRLSRLNAWLNQLSQRPGAHTSGVIITAAAAILLVSTAMGLLADGIGVLIQRAWVLPGRRPPACWLLRARQHRWDAAAGPLKDAILDATRDAVPAWHAGGNATRVAAGQARLDRQGTTRPTHPTRVGDRFAATGQRSASAYGIDDLALTWPRLVAVLPGELRSDISEAQDGYAAAARLAGWGVLYFVIAVFWWPSALVSVIVFAAAALRAYPAACTLADLVDTAIDLYIPELAKRLGVPEDTPRAAIGNAISLALGSSRPGTNRKR